MNQTGPADAAGGPGIGRGSTRSRASSTTGRRRPWRPRAASLKEPPATLLRPGPRSAMYAPIVVLVAILPGLYALRCWDLTPPGPWWGLRALAVLDGHWLDQVPAPDVGPEAEARVYHTVAMQPPLYAWLAAAGLGLSGDREPMATVLPSYVAGAAVVLLVFLHGRLWRGPGLGAAAAILTGFNRDLLMQMQQATPTTLALAGALVALLAYAQYARDGDAERPRLGWVLAGGLGLGLSLLSVGLVALLVVPIVVLHRGLLGPDPWAAPASSVARKARPHRPALVAGLGALAIGLTLAGPWYAWMEHRYGMDFLHALLSPPHSGGVAPRGLLARLAMLAPASLVPALFAAARAARRLLVRDVDDPITVGGALWIAWLAVAALGPAVLPDGPKPVLDLFVLVPLNLLAAQAILDLAGRRIPARALVWLAPTSAVAITWWALPQLRRAITALAHGHGLDASTALGLHLGLDLLVGLALLTRLLDRWARRRDDRRRRVLGVFLAALVIFTVGTGIREVRFRHRETNDLLSLREAILRRDDKRPFDVLAVVGPGPNSRFGSIRGQADSPAPVPGGRLRFVLRTALPRVPQVDLTRVEGLEALPEGRKLVILAGSAERLPYAVQSRLQLEAIHPGRSGVLDAYATADEDSRAARR